jgi:hypothetical protein
MAGTAAERCDASSSTRTWHWWLVRNLTAYVSFCACSETQARERWRAHVGARYPQRADAERLGGTAGVVGVGGTAGVERVSSRTPGARSTRQKDTTVGGASAHRGGAPASSAQSRTQKEKWSGFLCSLENACAGARACG